MIKTIIVDDEYNAREFLEKLLTRYFPNKFLVLAKCESIDDAVVAIEEVKPDLVFLDIQMPEKNGFELFKEVKNITFEVIFTTAHAEFGIEAVKQGTLDYLLKPITYPDLLEALRRYERKAQKNAQFDKFSLLIENLDVGNAEYKKVAFPTDNGFELVKISSILYCEADSNYCSVYCLGGKKIMLAKTLKYVEEMLPANLFHRIHKSYLVNLNYVTRFDKNHDLTVQLANGLSLPVAIRQKENLINAILQKN